MIRILPVLAMFAACFAGAHEGEPNPNRRIVFPDANGFVTVACDLHTHSVFSDGAVWPSIRVEEAVKDELDCLSSTEHIEHQPHKVDLPNRDRNRANQLTAENAQNTDVIVIPGSEITRDMPPGHANALFITDANRLVQRDAGRAFSEARKQGAFIFLNHPNWTRQRPDGIAKLEPMHLSLIEEDKLHGIEVVNDLTYSDEALAIALKHDLTIMGTSDVHGVVDWQYGITEGGHRPVTLVFAEERTAESIKEALFEKRTAVFFDGTLIARSAQMGPLIDASLHVRAHVVPDTSVYEVTLTNEANVQWLLRNNTKITLHDSVGLVRVPALGSTTFTMKPGESVDSVSLSFEVLNAVVAPGVHPTWSAPVAVTPAE